MRRFTNSTLPFFITYLRLRGWIWTTQALGLKRDYANRSTQLLVLTDGSRSIMHLSALKKTLKYLNLNDNCNIEDDAIPCLAVLTALQTLRVSNTSLTVDGIRALATVTADLSRSIAMEVPRSCVEYLSRKLGKLSTGIESSYSI